MLALLSGCIPVGPVAQVAKPGVLTSAMPSTNPAEKAGFVICGRWCLLGVIAGNWARIGHSHIQCTRIRQCSYPCRYCRARGLWTIAPDPLSLCAHRHKCFWCGRRAGAYTCKDRRSCSVFYPAHAHQLPREDSVAQDAQFRTLPSPFGNIR